MLNENSIKQNLINKDINIVIKDTTASTNDDVKSFIGESSLAVVIAENQTKGRGRNNRSFYSPSGKGVYMSILLTPNLSVTDGVKITTFVAVAVANAVEKVSGLKVGIKWVNDLFINGKKVSGILTESGVDFKNKKLSYTVCGIGINCYGLDFPSEISSIATSLEKEGANVNRNLLIAEILNNLSGMEREVLSGNYLAEYKNRCIVLNKQVTVVTGQENYTAIAVDITDSGALVVNKNGELLTVNSGDVSIRL